MGCSLASHVVIGEGTVLGTDVWCDHHTYIGCRTTIGDNVQVLYGARIYHRVTIGRDSWIGGFVCNDAVVEDGAFMLGQLIHRFADVVEGQPEVAPVVRAGAFVGTNALVVGGVEVGERAYIGAGAVLLSDAAPNRLYVGSPARDVGPAPQVFRVR
jgi:acetyltransferase-like isoleucine patch superfamily enzyme